MKGAWRGALPVIALAFEGIVLSYAQWRRPLRTMREPRVEHIVRNVAVAAFAAVPAIFIETPLAGALSRYTSTHRIGLLARLKLPAVIKTIAGVVLLDYSLYVWHRLTHRVPFLWRFHLVHHIDRDLDTTTAFRFHFGEMTLSVAWRAASIVAIGATPASYAIWQRLLIASIMFHHANLRLPFDFERRLGWFVMTPRLHGIHHADSQMLEDSNWSSGLSCWDRLHGTFRAAAPADGQRTGLPAYASARDLELTSLLTLPFGVQRDAWTAIT